MPIIRSAIKKMRQDKRQTVINKPIKTSVRTSLEKVIKNPNKENARLAFKVVDKAAKKHIIHKNKADRLKARISNILAKTTKTKSS